MSKKLTLEELMAMRGVSPEEAAKILENMSPPELESLHSEVESASEAVKSHRNYGSFRTMISLAVEQMRKKNAGVAAAIEEAAGSSKTPSEATLARAQRALTHAARSADGASAGAGSGSTKAGRRRRRRSKRRSKHGLKRRSTRRHRR